MRKKGRSSLISRGIVICPCPWWFTTVEDVSVTKKSQGGRASQRGKHGCRPIWQGGPPHYTKGLSLSLPTEGSLRPRSHKSGQWRSWGHKDKVTVQLTAVEPKLWTWTLSLAKCTMLDEWLNLSEPLLLLLQARAETSPSLGSHSQHQMS